MLLLQWLQNVITLRVLWVKCEDRCLWIRESTVSWIRSHAVSSLAAKRTAPSRRHPPTSLTPEHPSHHSFLLRPFVFSFFCLAVSNRLSQCRSLTPAGTSGYKRMTSLSNLTRDFWCYRPGIWRQRLGNRSRLNLSNLANDFYWQRSPITTETSFL